MDLEDERRIIETRLSTQWTVGGDLRTAVGWDKQPFEVEPGKNSIRISILDGDSANMSMGSPGTNVVRGAGVVMIQIWVPAGKGEPNPSRAARQLADLIRPIFQNWRSGTLLFRTMNVGTPQEEAPFLMLPVSFGFQRDAFHG